MSCVLPEPLDAETDVSLNVAPFVISTDPAATMQVNVTASSDFTVTAGDSNLGDTLYMRFFVDYDKPPAPSGPVALAQVGPRVNPDPGDFSRPAQMVTLVCGPQIPMDSISHQLTVVIADRPFIDNQPPLFRAVPMGAGTAEVSWRVLCQ